MLLIREHEKTGMQDETAAKEQWKRRNMIGTGLREGGGKSGRQMNRRL